MYSILLVFEKDNLADPITAKNSQIFYSGLVTIAKQSKAVEVLGENTLLIKLDDNSSLQGLHEVFLLATECSQTSYKHAILPSEIIWHDVSGYHKNKKSLDNILS